MQTRRTTRTARAASVKENENANARPSRIGTRGKALATASTTSSVANANGGVTRATAASRAKASLAVDSKVDIHAGKRKREALGEVPIGSNKPLSTAAAKGKEKEVFDGVVLKGKAVTTRQPLRTVAGTRQSTVAPAVKKPSVKVESEVLQESHQVTDENAMVVDPPQAHVPLSKIAVRRSTVIKEEETNVRPSHRPEGHRRVSSKSSRQAEVDLDDDEPVHKKRRTSSIPPEEDPQAIEEARLLAEHESHEARLVAEMEAFAEQEEADPENSPWDDLDAEDADDPVMVNEYVQDIFKYLKQLEVSVSMPSFTHYRLT